jgi:hypothetical protein
LYREIKMDLDYLGSKAGVLNSAYSNNPRMRTVDPSYHKRGGGRTRNTFPTSVPGVTSEDKGTSKKSVNYKFIDCSLGCDEVKRVNKKFAEIAKSLQQNTG